jgi:hypothetical protein
MQQLEQRAHAAAVSIVDPETGKHANVFVRRGPTQSSARAALPLAGSARRSPTRSASRLKAPVQTVG